MRLSLFYVWLISAGNLFAILVLAQEDIPAVLASEGDDFSILVAALELVGLTSLLNDPNGPYTVFAPTNDAFTFTSFPAENIVDCLIRPESGDFLASILQNHVVQERFEVSELTDGTVLTPLNEQSLTVTVSADTTIVQIDESTVVQPDIVASNGIIHGIDSILFPDNLDVTGFVTGCFADAEETEAPIVSDTDRDIFTTAEETEELTTFLDMVTRLNLSGALKAPNGPWTVFAPNDQAFANLPGGLLDCLSLEENSAILADILTYHVLRGSYNSTRLSSEEEDVDTTTISGDSFLLEIATSDPMEITVDSSTVLVADIFASNGVIHILDSVLLPLSVNLTDFLETCPLDLNEEESDAPPSPSGATEKWSIIYFWCATITTLILGIQFG